MEFIADPGYWKFAAPFYCVGLLLGFILFSKGSIGQNYLVKGAAILGQLVLLFMIFRGYGWIAALTSLIVAWQILGWIGAQVAMGLHEKSSGQCHPSRPQRHKLAMFFGGYVYAKRTLNYEDNDALLYAQAKAGEPYPKPPDDFLKDFPE